MDTAACGAFKLFAGCQTMLAAHAAAVNLGQLDAVGEAEEATGAASLLQLGTGHKNRYLACKACV